MATANPDRYVLITNIDYVSVGPVRTMTHALLLVDERHPFSGGDTSKRRYMARGYGTEGAWPTFDLLLPSLDFRIGDVEGWGVVMGDERSQDRPLVSNAPITFAGGDLEIVLSLADYERPLDLAAFDHVTDALAAISPKAIEHWRAPGIPRLMWCSRDELHRQMQAVRR